MSAGTTERGKRELGHTDANESELEGVHRWRGRRTTAPGRAVESYARALVFRRHTRPGAGVVSMEASVRSRVGPSSLDPGGRPAHPDLHASSTDEAHKSPERVQVNLCAYLECCALLVESVLVRVADEDHDRIDPTEARVLLGLVGILGATDQHEREEGTVANQ